jgi:hypothetical protein
MPTGVLAKLIAILTTHTLSPSSVYTHGYTLNPGPILRAPRAPRSK